MRARALHVNEVWRSASHAVWGYPLHAPVNAQPGAHIRQYLTCRAAAPGARGMRERSMLGKER